MYSFIHKMLHAGATCYTIKISCFLFVCLFVFLYDNNLAELGHRYLSCILWFIISKVDQSLTHDIKLMTLIGIGTIFFLTVQDYRLLVTEKECVFLHQKAEKLNIRKKNQFLQKQNYLSDFLHQKMKIFRNKQAFILYQWFKQCTRSTKDCMEY